MWLGKGNDEGYLLRTSARLLRDGENGPGGHFNMEWEDRIGDRFGAGGCTEYNTGTIGILQLTTLTFPSPSADTTYNTYLYVIYPFRHCTTVIV